jgi:redox-sensitive bicupin YhaK (pirin superfamily)
METNKIIQVKPLGFPWETQDPFLFCAYHRDEYPQGDGQMGLASKDLSGRNIGQDFVVKDGFRMYHGSHIPGFPYHPHRGFETITINKEGLVDHTDSLGAAGRYGDGDVQWMTSGKGVQHAEMFPLIHKDEENPMELFQIWLNLPKANKMVEPHFKMLWGDTIPVYNYTDLKGKNTTIEIIAGKLHDKSAPSPPPDSWAKPSSNEVAIWNIQMEAGAEWTLPAASAGINRTIYFYKGNALQIEGESLDHYHMADVEGNMDLQLINGSEPGSILILQGKPISEPVVQHGPFVMNTRIEIQQAFEDYQKTQFGGWPWASSGPVHARDKGKFALHADGKLETRS